MRALRLRDLLICTLLVLPACATVAEKEAPLPAPIAPQQYALLEEWRHVMAELGRSSTDCGSIDYVFPTDWDTLSCAAHGHPRIPTASSARDREVRARVASTRTTVRFDQTELADVAEFLSRISATHIEVHPSCEPEALAPITLQLDSPESVDKILDLVTTFRGLAWCVRDGVVEIASPPRVRGAMEVHLYDVKDLTGPGACFHGEEIGGGGDVIGEWCEDCHGE